MPTCAECGADHPPGDRCRGAFVDEDEAFATNPVRPGDLLEGQWRVESRLGKGGMSSVFLAEDERLGRKVAVKVLSEELCQEPEGLTRFERETRHTARMEHPNIVPVYATGRHGTRPFVVMKHLEGVPLSRYLRLVPTPLPLSEVRALMRQLCAALQYIHAQGLIHRDIKPSNVFVAPDGHLTVLDLGIALDLGADALTGTGVVMGTPQYIAPEQAAGTKIDHRADVFSASVLLSELLTGSRPDAASLKRLNAAVPRPLAAVVERGLAREPSRRYADAQELGAALEAAFEAALHPTAAPKRGRSGFRMAALGTGVGLAVVAAGIAWVQWSVPTAAPDGPEIRGVSAADACRGGREPCSDSRTAAAGGGCDPYGDRRRAGARGAPGSSRACVVLESHPQPHGPAGGQSAGSCCAGDGGPGSPSRRQSIPG